MSGQDETGFGPDEAYELCLRLFVGGDAADPELILGLPEGHRGDALYVIVPNQSGIGHAVKQLSPRSVVLLKKLIGAES